MSRLNQTAANYYLEKRAFISGQVLKNLGMRSLQKGKGFLQTVKPWFIPERHDIEQFGEFLHSNPLKRNIRQSAHVDPLTGEKPWLHGALAASFSPQYGKGYSQQLRLRAKKEYENLTDQLRTGQRGVTGTIRDAFSPLTHQEVTNKRDRILNLANKMENTKNPLEALKSLRGATGGETFANWRSYLGDNWPLALAYGFPALSAVDIMKNPDKRSTGENIGALAGTVAGGALGLPLGMIGGGLTASAGMDVGKFLGKQVDKLRAPKQPPQTMYQQYASNRYPQGYIDHQSY